MKMIMTMMGIIMNKKQNLLFKSLSPIRDLMMTIKNLQMLSQKNVKTEKP